MLPSTLLLLAGLVSAGPVAGPEPSEQKAPAGLAARIWQITDVVLAHHIDPPARQEMILEGLKRLFPGVGSATQAGLAARVSDITHPEQLTPLLDVAWSGLPAGKFIAPGKEFEADVLLIETMLAFVPGGRALLTAQELKVEEQFAGNRYVGLQIALSVDQETKRAKVATVLKGGPADRAGLKDNDLIEEIDGTSTEGLSVGQVVERLRGAEGTQVTIEVRQPKAAETRVLTITRGVLPKTTVRGIRDGSDQSKGVLINDNDSIGCLKFAEILGSTPHELRVLARRLEDVGARALILDLRSVSQAHLHPMVLLADQLLDGGTIGRMTTAEGDQTFRAEPDALFAGWPLAVLVDKDTPPTVQWLAAALQDNQRAIIVGTKAPSTAAARGPRRGLVRTGAQADVRSAVPVGDGSMSIEMVTGRLLRVDGRALFAAEGDAKDGLVPDVDPSRPPTQTRGMVQPESAFLPGNPLNGFTAADARKTNARASGDPVMAVAIQRLRELLMKSQ